MLKTIFGKVEIVAVGLALAAMPLGPAIAAGNGGDALGGAVAGANNVPNAANGSAGGGASRGTVAGPIASTPNFEGSSRAGRPAGNVPGPPGTVGPPPSSGRSVFSSQKTGKGLLGGSPSYPGSNSVATTTGNTSGGGTGMGIGNTSLAQPSAQSPIGSPDGPSTTPGGPPTAGTGNGLGQ